MLFYPTFVKKKKLPFFAFKQSKKADTIMICFWRDIMQIMISWGIYLFVSSFLNFFDVKLFLKLIYLIIIIYKYLI